MESEGSLKIPAGAPSAQVTAWIKNPQSEITIASRATYCNYTKQDTCANKLIVNETIYAEI